MEEQGQGHYSVPQLLREGEGLSVLDPSLPLGHVPPPALGLLEKRHLSAQAGRPGGMFSCEGLRPL